LNEAGYELGLIGFPEDELAEIMDTGELKEGLTDPDTVPEPPDEPTTRPGDLWILGNHRLLCGDAGKAEDVDRLLDGATIQLVNTDPPYNVRVEPRSSTAIAAGISSFAKGLMHHQAFDVARGVTDPAKAKKKMRPKDRPLEGDFVSDEAFAALLRAWFGQMARVLEPGRSFYVWGGYSNIGNMPVALADCGLYFSQAIIWAAERGRRVERKEDSAAEDGALDGQACGACCQGHPVLEPPQRECPRPLWRQRLDAYRLRTNRSALLHDGD